MQFNSEITNLCTTIGVTLQADEIASNYNFILKVIHIRESLTQELKLMTVSHELGHALQSSKEFELPLNPSDEDKFNFILYVEKDAWDKGEVILERLYPDLTPEFWDGFFAYRARSLESYENNPLLVTTKYEKYVRFIFEAHKYIKPMCLNTFTYN